MEKNNSNELDMEFTGGGGCAVTQAALRCFTVPLELMGYLNSRSFPWLECHICLQELLSGSHKTQLRISEGNNFCKSLLYPDLLHEHLFFPFFTSTKLN